MGGAIPVLAFFTDARSGPARRMDSLLAQLARKERGRLQVKRVDVERNPEVARRLHVEVVPTLLLIYDHRVVGRLEGRVSAPRIDRMLRPYLSVPAENPTAARAGG
jgi:thioredoxin 2